MPWGEAKRYLFQNHAVSICERNDGEPITLEEAYFIAGILNTSIVKRFIDASSDNRSFKIRPPVYIPLFNQQDEKHIRIFELAKQAGADAKSQANCLSRIQHEYLLIAITSLRPAARPYSFALTSPKCPQSLQRKVCDDGHPPHHFFKGRFSSALFYAPLKRRKIQGLPNRLADAGQRFWPFLPVEGRFPLSILRLPCGRPQASRSILSAFPRASLILKMVGGSHIKPRRAPANPSHCL